jgi:hypothetical protein
VEVHPLGGDEDDQLPRRMECYSPLFLLQQGTLLGWSTAPSLCVSTGCTHNCWHDVAESNPATLYPRTYLQQLVTDRLQLLLPRASLY